MFPSGRCFCPVVWPIPRWICFCYMFLLQMFYQGLIPNLLGLILIAHAARTIGAEVTFGWLAGVPAGATLLGALLLNETLSSLGWVGLVVLTVGLCVVAFGGAASKHNV